MLEFEGVCDLLVAFELVTASLEEEEEEGAGLSDLTYSFPSTLLLRRSLYSSPTSPEYRSAIVASSHL